MISLPKDINYDNVKSSLIFNPSLLYKSNGKNNNLLEYVSENKITFWVSVTNSKCILIYNKHKYYFGYFKLPPKPTKKKFKLLFNKNEWEKKYNEKIIEYQNKSNKYILRKPNEKQKLITHYEVWRCCVRYCNCTIILDTLTKELLEREEENISKVHNHPNQIDDTFLRKKQLNDMLESELLQNKDQKQREVYENFSATHFHLYNDKDKHLLPPSYNSAMKKKMNRIKNTQNNLCKNNLTKQIKEKQLNRSNKLTDSIQDIEYNEYLNFDTNNYALPLNTKNNLNIKLNSIRDSPQELIALSQQRLKDKLHKDQEYKLIQDFIRSLDPNAEEKTILVQDWIDKGFNCFILFSEGGFRMLDKKYCKIIGFDGTFGLSPQHQLWKQITKSYKQV